MSYLGYTQWAVAAAAGPEVKAMAMQVTLSDFSQMTYGGNSFALKNALSWTDMVIAIDYVAKMLNSKAIVFIVSDFLEGDISHPLKILAQRHDVVAVTVEDPSERDLPDIGIARLMDPETGDTFEVDTSSPNVRVAYSERVAAEREERKHLLRRLAIDEVAVRTEGGVVEPLLRFFRVRETRVRRR